MTTVEERNKRLLEGLTAAAKAERYGHDFYLMAAKCTEDAKGKEVFRMLAAEEMDHMRFLLSQHDSVLKTGRVDAELKLGRMTDLSGRSPIFSDQLKDRIKEANFEMTALSIGIQLERDAVAYYRKQSEAAEDEFVRGFFAHLALWESGHYHALLEQHEELKEDYWSASGFTAF
ncbi:MAG: ferritin family protein [candidate division Zixibacteria bacterium]|nr:ferritin family protein [candidate division Zixibacteria bacterium]